MQYYTYAYLREDRTPYYIGKGQGNRVYKKHQKGISVPKDKSRIIFLKQNLTEAEAFRHEIYMIAVFGRKDLGTGILHNRTAGGDGSSGMVHSEETKRKLSEANKNPSEETRRKLSELNKGKTLSEETKRKLSDANKGKTFAITFTNGKKVIITGIRRWVKENNYHYCSIKRLMNGKYKKHKDIMAVEKLDTTS